MISAVFVCLESVCECVCAFISCTLYAMCYSCKRKRRHKEGEGERESAKEERKSSVFDLLKAKMSKNLTYVYYISR